MGHSSSSTVLDSIPIPIASPTPSSKESSTAITGPFTSKRSSVFSECLPAMDCMDDDDRRTEQHVADRLRDQINIKHIGVKHEDVQKFFEAIDDTDLGLITGNCDNSLRYAQYDQRQQAEQDEEERVLPSPYMGGNKSKKAAKDL